MIPDNAADLANAPILGLLAVIALSLITLVAYVLLTSGKQNKEIVKFMVDQGAAASNTLRDEVLRMQGQLAEQGPTLRKTTEDAVAAKLEAGRFKTLLEDALQDKEQAEIERDSARLEVKAVKREVKKLNDYVKALVDIMKSHNIEVPPMEEGVESH